MFYPVFINLLSFILLYFFIKEKKNIYLLKKTILISICFLSSYFVFLISLKLFVNQVYYHAAAQDQMFVWVLNSNNENYLFLILNNLKEFLLTFKLEMISIFLLIFIFFNNLKKLIKNIIFFKNEVIVLFCLFIFLYLIGYYRYSLTTNLLFPLLLLLTKIISLINERKKLYFVNFSILITCNIFFFMTI